LIVVLIVVLIVDKIKVFIDFPVKTVYITIVEDTES
jgi:hypothetical protein